MRVAQATVMRNGWLCLLLSVGCAPIPDDIPLPLCGPVSFDTAIDEYLMARAEVTDGDLGALRFSWYAFPGQRLSIPITVGTDVYLHIDGWPASESAAFVSIADDTVATLAPHTPDAGILQSEWVTGIRPGTTQIVVRNADGKVIDTVGITVAEIDGIDFAGDWQAGGPTVVQGTPMRMRVRHLLGKTELVGSASSSFVFDGVIATADQKDVPYELLPWTDEVFFVAADVGVGGITAQFRGHSARIPITVIPVTMITNLALRVTKPNGPASITHDTCSLGIEADLRSGDTRVFGPPCKCSGTPDMKIKAWIGGYWPWVDGGGWPGEHPLQQLIATPERIGPHSVTCYVGDLEVPLALTFDAPPGG